MGETTPSLTPKQRRFLEEYLVDLNATQAAIRAGYSERTAGSQGHDLLKKPEMRSALDEAIAERSAKLSIKPEYVLRTIAETVERCRTDEYRVYRNGKPLEVETEDGKVAAVYAFDSKAVLQGCNLLGQHLGLWKYSMALTDADGRALGSELMDRAELARRVAYGLAYPERCGVVAEQ